MMLNDPYEVAIAVYDEATFIDFLRALSSDRRDEVHREKEHSDSPYGPGASGWEHGTIEDYLEAAAAWAEDWNNAGGAGKVPATEDLSGNPWQKCALILVMGKVYE